MVGFHQNWPRMMKVHISPLLLEIRENDSAQPETACVVGLHQFGVQTKKFSCNGAPKLLHPHLLSSIYPRLSEAHGPLGVRC